MAHVTETRESPPAAARREVDALFEVASSDATQGELDWLRHQLERMLEVRARRVEAA